MARLGRIYVELQVSCLTQITLRFEEQASQLRSPDSHLTSDRTEYSDAQIRFQAPAYFEYRLNRKSQAIRPGFLKKSYAFA
ncbi:MAG: hypothetical protein CMK09_15285 [Ponticaulis sp.]|nr:hypothetical protein [Ponticaulis sp.]